MSRSSEYYSRAQFSPDAAGSKMKPRQSPQFDSGFGDLHFSLPIQAESGRGLDDGPPRPKLLLGQNSIEDVENGDSGIHMEEDDADERDCIATITSRQPMVTDKIDRPGKISVPASTTDGGSTSMSVVTHKNSFKTGPRIPKRSVSSGSNGNSNTHTSRTIIPRSASPKNQSSHRTNNLSNTAAFQHISPLSSGQDKENNGPSSMPVIHNSNPLTCNNFHSLPVERVPPVVPNNVSIDIYQLRQYLGLFLPDNKEGDT